MTPRCFFLMIAVLVLSLSGRVFSQEGTPYGIVLGRITDRGSGEGIAGATVAVDTLALGTVTDADGAYMLPSLPPGSYRLRFSAIGYEAVEESVTVSATEPLLLNVALEPGVVHEQSEVVVTATRTARSIEDVTVRVEVIPEEEIAEKIAMMPGSVSMVVSELPGVRLQTTSGTSGAADLRIQGLSGRYTQLLTDGIPIFGGMAGGLSLIQLPPLNLRQVEVVKGASSVLYGADAISGVVNFITKMPGERELTFLANRTTQQGTDFSAFYGEQYGTIGTTLLASHNRQELYDVDDDGYSDLARYERTTVSPRLVLQPNEQMRTIISGGYSTEERLGGAMNLRPGRQAYRESIDSRRWDAAVAGNLVIDEQRSLSGKIAAVGNDREALSGTSFFHARQHLYYAEAQYTHEMNLFSLSHNMLIGGAVSIDDFDERSEITLADRSYYYSVPGFFMQDEVALAPRWNLLLSGRVDFHNIYGTIATPRLSVMFKPAGNLTYRLGGGTGFKAPTIFSEEGDDAQPGYLAPRSSLTVERAQSVSFDMNYRKFLGSSNVTFNASFFLTRVEDPVRAVPTGLSTGPIVLDNIDGEVLSRGGEFIMQILFGDLHCNLNYTYVYATEEEDGRTGELNLTPRHSFGGVVVWESEEQGMRVGFETYLFSSQLLDGNPFRDHAPGYAIVGLLVQKELGIVDIFFNAENIFDQRPTRYDPQVVGVAPAPGIVQLPVWAPIEGRVFNAGIKLHL